jgi:hypothetical protein
MDMIEVIQQAHNDTLIIQQNSQQPKSEKNIVNTDAPSQRAPGLTESVVSFNSYTLNQQDHQGNKVLLS